jgi:hypothetical protein
VDLSILDQVGGPKVVAGVVAGAVLLWFFTRTKVKGIDGHTQRKVCGSCGWQGNVSTFKPKCAKCGAPL